MTHPEPIDISGAKVLIVDDVPANLKVLRGVLEPRGYRILLAPRGDVALRIARAELPDLILLDVMMPELDGFEVCRQLKAEPGTAPIPVIFITAKDDPEDIVKGFTMGGVDYISKPFQTEVVLARTQTHLRNSLLTRELRCKNLELEKARAAAEQAKKAQGAFLATMSHEIRTPMNSVLGMSSLLLETEMTPDQRDCVETIRSGSQSLLKIINEILDFSKIESGKMTLEAHSFNLQSCAEETLDLLAAKAAEKKLDLCYRPDAALPEQWIGDATRVRQILLNLAGNAVKFTPSGEVVITVRAVQDDPPDEGTGKTSLHFSVRDTGIGIPEEKQSRLFQAFSQVDSSTTRTYGGTGLGLAISRRLAELMKGRMWVESTPGVGSTFHFVIPLEPDKQSSPTERPRLTPLAAKSALVVEDNGNNREILSRHLKEFGLVPHAVATANEAKAWLDSHKADLAIVDLQLPDCDGLEFAQSIRKSPRSKSIHLLLLSLNPMKPDDPRLAVCKANAVVTKPVRRTQLYNALRRVAFPEERTTEAMTPHALDAKLSDRLPLRILLADDHEVNQKVVSRILNGFGYGCEVAANGLEVLQAIERQPFDVLFLDVQMPELDGYETARQIRSRWDDSKRPFIIAMTANALRGDREKCLEAGMDDYIAKPVEIIDIQRALEHWGGLRHGHAAPSSQASSHSQPARKTSQVEEDPAALLDWKRVNQMIGNNPKSFLELLSIYREQTLEQFRQIELACQAGKSSEVHMLAHKCKGASATCGLTGIVKPMREIETRAKSGDLSETMQLLAQAEENFNQVQDLLSRHVESLPS